MTIPAKRARLTALDLEVLRAAAREDGSLYRSESVRNLYDSYLVAFSRRTKVNRQIRKLVGGDEPLLHLGKMQPQPRRSWLLTDAGRRALDAHPEG